MQANATSIARMVLVVRDNAAVALSVLVATHSGVAVAEQ